MKKRQMFYGNHWLASFNGCKKCSKGDDSRLIINNFEDLEKIIVDGLKEVGATILSSESHQFQP